MLQIGLAQRRPAGASLLFFLIGLRGSFEKAEKTRREVRQPRIVFNLRKRRVLRDECD